MNKTITIEKENFTKQQSTDKNSYVLFTSQTLETYKLLWTRKGI